MAGRAKRLGVSAAIVAALLIAGCEKVEPEPGPSEPPRARAEEPWSAASASRCDLWKRPRPVEGLRCGRLERPFEMDEPSLGTFGLFYGVLPRERTNRPSAGTIFIAEGGPGYAGVPYARTYQRMLGSLLRDHDLVLVDMRGTGRSEAIDCPPLQHGRGDHREALASCAERLGPLASSYRTSAAADDIEALRRELDVGRISLYGGSYGTYLGQTYAFRHPDSLAALVIDSAYPLYGESPWYPSLLPTGLRSLELSCRRSPGCAGGARERFERVARLLRTREGSAGPLLDALINSAFGPPQTYLALDAAVSDYLRGRPALLKRKIDPGDGDFGDPRLYSHGLELAASCNDYPLRWSKRSSFERRERELDAAVAGYPAKRTRPFTPEEVANSELYGYADCIVWPQPSRYYEPPASPGDTPPDMPTLVISGELDDITTPREADEAAATFEDARRLEVPNAGHVPAQYVGRFDADAAVRRFFRRFG